MSNFMKAETWCHSMLKPFKTCLVTIMMHELIKEYLLYNFQDLSWRHRKNMYRLLFSSSVRPVWTDMRSEKVRCTGQFHQEAQFPSGSSMPPIDRDILVAYTWHLAASSLGL